MNKIICVEGMRCPHCEASVKKALESLSFVEAASADRNGNKVTLTLCGDFDEACVSQTIADKGFSYKGIL